jgi:small subunit ribosomal protein S4
MQTILRALDLLGGRIPHWLEFNRTTLSGRVVSLPKREDVNFDIKEQMIVELYSK